MDVEADAYRMFTRIHFDRHVNIEFISDTYQDCPIRDLSIAGMFVLGNFRQHKEKNCHIDLVQKGVSSELCLQALARVVRIDQEGMAVEFSSMTHDSFMFLQVSLLNEAENSVIFKELLCECCPFEITDHLPEAPWEITSY